MKKILCLFSFLIMPIVCFGFDDACTKPNEFAIDKRCYVTDAQKKQKPYNAVVGFVGAYGDIDCTGSIVKQDNRLFLYTAKHCIDKRGQDFSVLLTDGTKQMSHVFSVGNYRSYFSLKDGGEKEENPDGDWAVLIFDETDLPFVDLSNRPENISAMSLGYGALKIMSDTEIENFKKEYMNFLKHNKSPYVVYDEKKRDYVDEGKIRVTSKNKLKYGFTDDGGIYTANGYVDWFLRKTGFEKKFFDDSNNLKVSHCKYDSNNKNAVECQGWQGDSGGGLFDSEGNLIGIRSSGKAIIGGANHASAQDFDGFVDIENTKTTND